MTASINQKINLRSLDLNLLMVFEVVLEERNISRAAARLGRTQSTISNALTRLRHSLKDELFLKSGKGVAPTDFTLRIAPSIIQSLDILRQSFENEKTNETINNTKPFTIAVNDYIECFYLPLILPYLKRKEPNLLLKVVDINQNKMQDELSGGNYDLAIDSRLPMSNSLSHQLLLEEDIVLALADGHPALAVEPLDTDDFLKLDFVLHRPRNREMQSPEVLLRSRNIYRKSSLQVTTINSMLQFVRHSNYAATLPLRLIENKNFGSGLAYRNMPFDFPKIKIVQIWHPKHANSADHIWIRSAIKDAMAQIEKFSSIK